MATSKNQKPRDLLHDLKINREQFQNSAEWFMKEVENINSSDARRTILNLQSRRSRYLTAGRMYLFAYDAKHKDKLPYWDSFPLIFPISKGDGHFIGLNLHYLTIPMRLKAINELMRFANNQSMSANVRLVMQWNMVKALSMSKGLGIEDCIKMYLNNHVRSPFIEIPPTSWQKVATLALDKWNYRSQG